MRPYRPQQPRHGSGVGGAAAEQPVVAEEPEIALPRDRHRRRLGRRLLARIWGAASEQRVELRRLEAEGGEVDAERREVRNLQRQHLAVPARLLGEPVVGEHVGPLLRLAEVPELDHRHPGEPELPRRHDPAVAGDDAVIAVDQHRVGEAVLADRAGDQRDLVVAVRPRVPGVGYQLPDGPVLDGERLGINNADGHSARSPAGPRSDISRRSWAFPAAYQKIKPL
jgi:hypothetical protein